MTSSQDRNGRFFRMMILGMLALALVAVPTRASASGGGAQAPKVASPSTANTSSSAKCVRAKRNVRRAKLLVRKAKGATARKRARARLAKAQRAMKKACRNRPPRLRNNSAVGNPIWIDSRQSIYNIDTGLIARYEYVVRVEPAVDPDGDRLIYSWKSTTGTIRQFASGSRLLSAIWTLLPRGYPQRPDGEDGVVTVIVRDGKGGRDTASCTGFPCLPVTQG